MTFSRNNEISRGTEHKPEQVHAQGDANNQLANYVSQQRQSIGNNLPEAFKAGGVLKNEDVDRVLGTKLQLAFNDNGKTGKQITANDFERRDQVQQSGNHTQAERHEPHPHVDHRGPNYDQNSHNHLAHPENNNNMQHVHTDHSHDQHTHNHVIHTDHSHDQHTHNHVTHTDHSHDQHTHNHVTHTDHSHDQHVHNHVTHTDHSHEQHTHTDHAKHAHDQHVHDHADHTKHGHEHSGDHAKHTKPKHEEHKQNEKVNESANQGRESKPKRKRNDAVTKNQPASEVHERTKEDNNLGAKNEPKPEASKKIIVNKDLLESKEQKDINGKVGKEKEVVTKNEPVKADAGNGEKSKDLSVAKNEPATEAWDKSKNTSDLVAKNEVVKDGGDKSKATGDLVTAGAGKESHEQNKVVGEAIVKNEATSEDRPQAKANGELVAKDESHKIEKEAGAVHEKIGTNHEKVNEDRVALADAKENDGRGVIGDGVIDTLHELQQDHVEKQDKAAVAIAADVIQHNPIQGHINNINHTELGRTSHAVQHSTNHIVHHVKTHLEHKTSTDPVHINSDPEMPNNKNSGHGNQSTSTSGHSSHSGHHNHGHSGHHGHGHQGHSGSAGHNGAASASPSGHGHTDPNGPNQNDPNDPHHNNNHDPNNSPNQNNTTGNCPDPNNPTSGQPGQTGHCGQPDPNSNPPVSCGGPIFIEPPYRNTDSIMGILGGLVSAVTNPGPGGWIAMWGESSVINHSHPTISNPIFNDNNPSTNPNIPQSVTPGLIGQPEPISNSLFPGEIVGSQPVISLPNLGNYIIDSEGTIDPSILSNPLTPPGQIIDSPTQVSIGPDNGGPSFGQNPGNNGGLGGQQDPGVPSDLINGSAGDGTSTLAPGSNNGFLNNPIDYWGTNPSFSPNANNPLLPHFHPIHNPGVNGNHGNVNAGAQQPNYADGSSQASHQPSDDSLTYKHGSHDTQDNQDSQTRMPRPEISDPWLNPNSNDNPHHNETKDVGEHSHDSKDEQGQRYDFLSSWLWPEQNNDHKHGAKSNLAIDFSNATGRGMQIKTENIIGQLVTLFNDQSKNKKQKPQTIKTYTVKAGDTLETIAANMLGDARLGLLLYIINKSKFVGQTGIDWQQYKLSEGMELVLPSEAEIHSFRLSLFGKLAVSSGKEAEQKIVERRQNVERLLGNLNDIASVKENSNTKEIVVRFGDTLRSIALKHPALNDVFLWKLLAQCNNLTTDVDAKGVPLAVLQRGMILALPTEEDIISYRAQQAKSTRSMSPRKALKKEVLANRN